MGKLPGFRQVTLYLEPALYERVRCTAYTLGEEVYKFAGEAFAHAVVRRTTKVQRAIIESMAKQNLKNGSSRDKRR